MRKRTNSVISSLYQPLGHSKLKTASCMCAGGIILVCLGAGLIVTTFSADFPRAVSSRVDETSVLISGPTCLVLGLLVTALSGFDVWRYRRARSQVESQLSRVVAAPLADNNPKVAIVINNTLWPS